MRRLGRMLALLVCVAATAEAQQPVTVDDLTAPTSPAFVLLDTAPSAVERPENPKMFAVNLLNSVLTGGGLPQNYALEVAPYWLMSHAGLSFQKYQNPSVGQGILQSFMVSIATVPIPGAKKSDDPLGTRLGLGFRVNVWNGRPNPHLEERVDELARINGRILDAIDTARNATEAVAATAAAEAEQLARTQARTMALEIQGLDAERVGFFLTFAGGQVWGYPNDDVEIGRRERTGFWMTPSYRFRACPAGRDTCESRIDVVGVVRALMEKGKDTRWDYGGRVVWRPLRELYLSAESVHRRDGNLGATVAAADGSTRAVGILEYRIKSDLVLFGSFGRDFEKESGVKPLVSYLGLNVGFGKKPLLTPDERKR